MIDSNQVKKDATEASKNLKTTLVIYDYIRSLSKNIDDFSTFKIFLSKEISGKTPKKFSYTIKEKLIQIHHQIKIIIKLKFLLT